MISSLNYELCRNTLFIFQIFMVFFQIYFCYKCVIVRQVVVWSLNHVRLFCDSINSNPPGFSVHGISKATILEWVAISFFRGSFWPRDWTHISCGSGKLAGGFFTSWATSEAQEYWSGEPIPSPGDLLNPGIEPGSYALQAESFISVQFSRSVVSDSLWPMEFSRPEYWSE